ncbi:MAG: sulfurtransferase [Rhodobacteraceae bacterium]|nr:sulfurtransferase [Paracoccaceae bacterium]
MTEHPARLLVRTDWLAHHLSDPALRIVDTRKGDGYVPAHIPGAVALGVSPLLHDAGDVIAAEDFAAPMSRLGIGSDTMVIAYDDGNNLFAARLWWVLNYYGYDKVRVLDGGWDLWVAEGRPVDSGMVTPVAAQLELQRNAALIADTDNVLASLRKSESQLLDVRTDAEWTRTDSTGSTMPGHIPSAVHLVWSDVIDPESHRFREPCDLKKMFGEVGVRPDNEVITYCQGGIRAAHTVFALRLAGFPAVRNYEGS